MYSFSLSYTLVVSPLYAFMVSFATLYLPMAMLKLSFTILKFLSTTSILALYASAKASMLESMAAVLSYWLRYRLELILLLKI